MIKFYLYHSQFNKPVLIEAPEGWDSLNLTVRRDRQWHGVFFEYSPRLRFVKKGKAILHNLVDIFGIEADCAVIVMRRDAQTRKWEQEYEGAINFAEYKISKLYFEANVENTGFVQRFKNAQDVKYKLTATPTLTLHSQGLRKVARFLNEQNTTITWAGAATRYAIMEDVVKQDDALGELQTYPDQVRTDPAPTLRLYKIKLKNGQTGTGTLTVKLRCRVRGITIQSPPPVIDPPPATGEMRLVAERWRNGVVSLITGPVNTVMFSNFGGAFINSSGFSNFVFTFPGIAFEPDDELYVYFQFTNFLHQECFLDFQNENSIEFAAVTFTQPSTAKVDYVFEAFDQVITNMVGAAGRLRSSLYGRTDSPLVYPADGAGALRAITSGNNIRGQNNLFASFADMYRTFNLLDNIGVGIRKENGIEVVDIEPLAHFYAGREVMRLNFVSDLEKASDTEQYYNELEIGYETQLEENAQQEFNRKREFEFPITKVKRKLALMAPYTTAGTIIEQRRREAQAALDSRVDNNNFVIQLRRDGALLVTAKNEGFTSVTGVDAPESLYNLALAPARLLRKHGNKFSAFLHKIGGIIAARFNEGNNTLSTQLAAEAAPISEAADVAVNSLATRMYDAEVYTFRKQLTHQQIQALKNDPYGYISFSESDRDHKRMYVLKAERDATTREVKFTGLKAY